MYVIRTITAAVLFVCMLVPVITPVYLQIKQLHVQHEMLEKMERTALISIRVKAEHIEWVKPGKECMIGAEMFDVKYIKQEDDQLLLTGLYDVKEKELKRMAAKDAQEQSRQSKYIIQLLSLVLITPEHISVQPIKISQNKVYPLFNRTFQMNPFIEFMTPPPRFDAYYFSGMN